MLMMMVVMTRSVASGGDRGRDEFKVVLCCSGADGVVWRVLRGVEGLFMKMLC